MIDLILNRIDRPGFSPVSYPTTFHPSLTLLFSINIRLISGIVLAICKNYSRRTDHDLDPGHFAAAAL